MYSYASHKNLLGLNLNFGSHIGKGAMVSYKVLIVRNTKKQKTKYTHKKTKQTHTHTQSTSGKERLTLES